MLLKLTQNNRDIGPTFLFLGFFQEEWKKAVDNRLSKKMPARPIRKTSPPRTSLVKKVEKKIPLMKPTAKATSPVPKVVAAKAPLPAKAAQASHLAPTESKASPSSSAAGDPAGDPWTIRRLLGQAGFYQGMIFIFHGRTVDGRQVRVNPPPPPVELRRGAMYPSLFCYVLFFARQLDD